MKKKKSKFKYRPFLIFTLFIVLVTITFSLGQYKTKELEKNIVSTNQKKTVIYPTLYSDKNITINAIESDPKFKNTIVFNRESLTANVGSSVKKDPTYIRGVGKVENGTWLWTPILLITPQYRDSIIFGAKKLGINSIYLSIDSYLDIYTMPPSPEKEEKKKLFDSILSDFIKKANENGITVDAEGGWRNWAEEGHLYKAFAVLDYTIEFNKTHTEKFRGFQYDVEPYLLNSYYINKKGVLGNFVNLIDETVFRLEGSDLELSVVIPDFYDGASGETPTFFYGGRLGYAFDHLLSILDNRLGSKIIIMSYRNFSQGRDGSIEISKDEIALANKYETKVILAQEVGDVKPSYITFYKKSKSYFEKETKILQKSFEKEKSFNGLAIHYINAFMEMK